MQVIACTKLTKYQETFTIQIWDETTYTSGIALGYL